jgi:glycosyltransferase involved in cell wall biosynthesis
MPEIASTRPMILCLVAYYLPGYRSGGPVRTIANFVDQLGDEFDIRIVCRDRDALDTKPYSNVAVDAWNAVGKAQVFYASENTVSLRGIRRLLRDTPHDVLYLNSFFSFGFSILPLLARRLHLAPRKACVIAPRGEFSQGALELKAAKKRLFISLAKSFGLYRGLHWQASSEFEATDIRRELGALASELSIAPDLLPALDSTKSVATSRRAGPLRIIFLSRISPMKNLDFLLRVLAKVTASVELAIYGPREDASYWKQCQRLLEQLPENIYVSLHDQVPNERVRSVFAEYDLFAFPTRGENFGHVILESLSVGTPVLLSDQTPWLSNLHNGLEVLELDDDLWVVRLNEWAKFSYDVLLEKRYAALAYARDYLTTSPSLTQNKKLFVVTSGAEGEK